MPLDKFLGHIKKLYGILKMKIWNTCIYKHTFKKCYKLYISKDRLYVVCYMVYIYIYIYIYIYTHTHTHTHIYIRAPSTFLKKKRQALKKFV